MMTANPPTLVTTEELTVYGNLLEAAGCNADKRLVSRVANRLGKIRKSISKQQIQDLLGQFGGVADVAALFGVSPSTSTIDGKASGKLLFASLVALNFAHDQGQNVVQPSLAVINAALSANRRELDPLLARLISLLSKSAGKFNAVAEVHGPLMAALRTCQIRHDGDSHAAVYNALLRGYVATQQWDLMDKLLVNSAFPVEKASHNQLARFQYYSGRLEAVKLNYPRALELLEQAARHAPADRQAFQLASLKVTVVVRLLIGEIPELAILKTPGMHHYYLLARAVRQGDLTQFRLVLKGDSLTAFTRDGLEGLVVRLHQNVLKAGLKRIHAAYSSISLNDITRRLGLESEEDCRMILLKAVRDGVISGTISGSSFTATRPSVSQQATQDAFDHRIKQCQSLIQEAVKAMRFSSGLKKGASAAAATEVASPGVIDVVEEDDDYDMMDEGGFDF